MMSDEAERRAFADMREAERALGDLIRLPSGTGLTRQDVIDGLRETLAEATRAEKEKDPTFVSWPDMEALLDYIEAHGLPPKTLPQTA